LATKKSDDEIPEKDYLEILDDFIAHNRKFLEEIGKL
jgi:hypothetical protein